MSFSTAGESLRSRLILPSQPRKRRQGVRISFALMCPCDTLTQHLDALGRLRCEIWSISGLPRVLSLSQTAHAQKPNLYIMAALFPLSKPSLMLLRATRTLAVRRGYADAGMPK